MTDLTGRTLSSRFRVVESIGRGGMAEVYKIWDGKRSAYLAMKVLHADLAEDTVFLRRFKREAQTLAQLQHPNIVRFYGLEEDGDLVFMLMDYVEGTTLRKEIRRLGRPFVPERILEIMRPVCSAMHYAHESNIVHCDIKPANIMIDASGRVLVADFGIARMAETATATMVGAGTPAYMAPEQARGENPTPQTDIYALGIMLYEMLSGGERPFTGEHARTTGSTSEKIRWEQLNLEPPSLRKLNPTVAPDLEAVVLKCLEKSPDRRFASVQEFLNALTLAIPGAEKAAETKAKVPGKKKVEPTPVTPPSQPPPGRYAWMRRWGWTLAVGIILALAVSLGLHSKHPLNHPKALTFPTAFVLSTPNSTPTSTPLLTETPTIIPSPTLGNVPNCLYVVQKGKWIEMILNKLRTTTRINQVTCPPLEGNQKCNLSNPSVVQQGWVLQIPGVARASCLESMNGTPSP
jgi:serine/threonine protein kinase